MSSERDFFDDAVPDREYNVDGDWLRRNYRLVVHMTRLRVADEIRAELSTDGVSAEFRNGLAKAAQIADDLKALTL